MKVKIYVDWNNEEILMEKDYEERTKLVEKEIKQDCFLEYLECYLKDEDFSLLDIYNFKEEEKKEIEKRVLEICKEQAERNMENDFEMITLDI